MKTSTRRWSSTVRTASSNVLSNRGFSGPYNLNRTSNFPLALVGTQFDSSPARVKNSDFWAAADYTFLKLTVFALPGILPVSVLLVRVELL